MSDVELAAELGVELDATGFEIPASVAPEQNRQDGVYVLGNARKLVVPESSAVARVCSLNSLRTVLPALALLRLTDCSSDIDALHANKEFDVLCVIQDWYFKNNELRMMVIELHTYKLFDAFVMREDLMHMFVASGMLKPPVNLQGFTGFYIKSHKSNDWISMPKSLCAGIRMCKFNFALQTYLYKRGGILSECSLETPQSTWKPFAPTMTNLLYCTPQLCSLNSDHVCCFPTCVCRTRAEWTVLEALKILSTGVDAALSEHVHPTVCAIQSCVLLMKQGTVQPEKAKRKRKHNFNAKGERLPCLYSKTCMEPATCFWPMCCKATEPVACRLHTKKMLKQNAQHINMLPCPKHKLSSKPAAFVW
jgi:hypothetical protein